MHVYFNRGQELHEEIEKLRSELEARPTMRQWTQAQRERYIHYYIVLPVRIGDIKLNAYIGVWGGLIK